MGDRVVVVGAGIGGLSAAVELAKNGREVIVLEAHIYSGGCAGTFYHQGYRFDAGATLPMGFSEGAALSILSESFKIEWGEKTAERAMEVHLPSGIKITRWVDPERWKQERIRVFGMECEGFWQWQEYTGELLWDFAIRFPEWLPQTAGDYLSLIGKMSRFLMDKGLLGEWNALAEFVFDMFRPLSAKFPNGKDLLRQYLDAQLLISGQAICKNANALYSAAALDISRQGVGHLPDGIGTVAEKLTVALEDFGGKILYRHKVSNVISGDNEYVIRTKSGKEYLGDIVIFNIPPWNVREILSDHMLPIRMRYLSEKPRKGQGAFMLYLGVDGNVVPPDFALHHQIILREPLGEGNSLFVSISPEGGEGRAPQNGRAITISSHTRLDNWWELFETDREAYEARKQIYTENVILGVEKLLPKIRKGIRLCLPGTPVTFQRFTHRKFGWVGGFPQSNLFQSWGPRLGKGLWLVGDSIFPGQSIAATALGGLRIAKMIIQS